MYTKEGHSGMFQRRMGRRAAFWGGELFVHRCAIARHSLLVVGQGCGLHPFAACSAAGEQRNILSPRQVPPAAVALRNTPAGVVPRACERMEVPTHPHWRLAPHRENCIFPATACAVYPFASPRNGTPCCGKLFRFMGLNHENRR